VSTAAPVYLDYAATTPVRPEVAALLADWLARPGNAGSQHAPGRAAAAAVAAARAQVAALVGAAPADIVFTSGATESNNLALQGWLRGVARRRKTRPHAVVTSCAHKAVLEPLRGLAREGVIALTVLDPDRDGRLAPAVLAAALTPDTALFSLLLVNNETGVIQDLPALAAVCGGAGLVLHVDAAQAAGRLPLSVDGVGFLSLSGHKLGGPPGIGALYVAPGLRADLSPLQVGGGQERGLRAGSLPVPLIAAFGLACTIAGREREAEALRLAGLRDRLWQALRGLPGVVLNGHREARVPGILNLTFAGVEGEALFTALPGLALSTGSACSSATGEPSYVLRALGRDSELAQASLRLSFGWATTEHDIDVAAAAVQQAVTRLQGLAPFAPLPVGDWLEPGARIGVGEAGGVRLGTWVRFLLRHDGARIVAARCQAYGCPAVLAACERVLARLPATALAAPDAGNPEEWRTGVDAPIEKLGRMLIIEDALRSSCRDALDRSAEGAPKTPWPSP
jgi:cysteine desulfurase